MAPDGEFYVQFIEGSPGCVRETPLGVYEAASAVRATEMAARDWSVPIDQLQAERMR